MRSRLSLAATAVVCALGSLGAASGVPPASAHAASRDASRDAINAPIPTLAGAHAFPVAGPAWFSAGHHEYPATDVMAACGTVVVSPATGIVLELSRVDPWRGAVDDPATRGGRFVSILGTDGVRYYLAHLSSISAPLHLGSWVMAGTEIARVGRSGRAGACHLHVALSPRCPNPEWWVRRGVVSPYRVLRAWRAGTPASPVPAVMVWRRQHPGACASPAAVGAR